MPLSLTDRAARTITLALTGEGDPVTLPLSDGGFLSLTPGPTLPYLNFRVALLGTCSVQAVLVRVVELQARAAAAATVAGQIERVVELQARAAAVATVAGQIERVVELRAQASGAASLSGRVERVAELQAQATGAATLAGQVERVVELQARAAGAVTLIGQIELVVWSIDGNTILAAPNPAPFAVSGDTITEAA